MNPIPLTRRARRRSGLAVVAAGCLLVAACGDDDGGNSATPEVVIDGVAEAAEPVDDGGSEAGAAAEVSDEELALQFAQCMRDEGVDWPDPVTNADGSIDLFGGQGPAGAAGANADGSGAEDAQAAAEVCGPLIEGASFLPGGGGGLDAGAQDDLLEFAQCLRDEGLDVDDPDFDNFGPGAGGGGGGAGLFGDGFDPQDPAAQGAIEACQGLFAGGGFGPGGNGPRGGEE